MHVFGIGLLPSDVVGTLYQTGSGNAIFVLGCTAI